MLQLHQICGNCIVTKYHVHIARCHSNVDPESWRPFTSAFVYSRVCFPSRWLRGEWKAERRSDICKYPHQPSVQKAAELYGAGAAGAQHHHQRWEYIASDLQGIVRTKADVNVGKIRWLSVWNVFVCYVKYLPELTAHTIYKPSKQKEMYMQNLTCSTGYSAPMWQNLCFKYILCNTPLPRVFFTVHTWPEYSSTYPRLFWCRMPL